MGQNLPKPRVLIMAGGTGGHVMPGLSVAHFLMEKGVDVVWLGTAKGLEAKLVPQHGIPLHTIRISAIRGKGLWRKITAPLRLLSALWQAMLVMRRVQPDAVLGMGGYASGPGGIAAWLMHKRLVIHEQNAIAGMTNKVLAKIANEVCAAFPGAFKARQAFRLTGNPVREDIASLHKADAIQDATHPLRLLVLGGSLGAVAINEVVPAAVAQMDIEIDILHQAGKDKDIVTYANYQRAEIEAKVKPFIEDMAAAYEWADLVVCRAGALTVSELAAAGVPSILVPFPFAVDDHQTANGQFLVDNGAALMRQQNELTPQWLAQILIELAHDRARLARMAVAAKAQGRLNACAEVASVLVE